LRDLSSEEIFFLLNKTREVKAAFRQGKLDFKLAGRAIALIFEKPSTRTRVSFGSALVQLGATPLFLSQSEMQVSRGETLEDTARILSSYVSAIVMRTFEQARLVKLAQAASVPVVNALTDEFHPCQILADLFTIYEHFDLLAGLKLAYVGDGNNVANSLLLGCAKVGINISVATPRGFEPSQEVFSEAKSLAKGRSLVEITHQAEKAVEGADIVYTDVWFSMGQAVDAVKVKKFKKFQVNERLLSKAKTSAIFMHCLPAHRGEEVTDGVIDGVQSKVWVQAENRLHLQKALLVSIVR
jgi:ornithine carbamoyltransferase